MEGQRSEGHPHSPPRLWPHSCREYSSSSSNLGVPRTSILRPRARQQAAVLTERVSVGGSASRVQCQLWPVQTATEAKGMKDAAGQSFLLGSSVISGKAKMKVKLDSDLVLGPASN